MSDTLNYDGAVWDRLIVNDVIRDLTNHHPTNINVIWSHSHYYDVVRNLIAYPHDSPDDMCGTCKNDDVRDVKLHRHY